MITEIETLIPEAHARKIVFRDHFGHEHTIVVPTHTAVEDPMKPFPLGPVQIKEFDAQIGNIRQMMYDREKAFLEHCLAHPQHSQHPLVLSHPEHPTNKQKPQQAQPAQTKDCGCSK